MKKTVVMIGSGVVPIPPKRGGATEIIIYEISRFMPKNKFDVYVLDRKESSSKEKEIVDGAVYLRYKVPKFGNVFLLRLTELVFGARAVREIRKINSKNRCDIVHAHTVFSALPIATAKFLLPSGSKLVYTCHNPAWNVPEKEMDLFNGVILAIESFVMKRSDFVTTVSDTMRKNIIRRTGMDPRKIQRIYNFVDNRKFSPKKEEKKGPPKVIFVGKLIPNKGVEYLLRAASIVRKKHPEVKFLVVGPGSFEYDAMNRWLELVKELGLQKNVVFTGGLSEESLSSAYASSDIFCFPTLRESFGMVIAEAMSSGLPVITTDMDVLREIVGDNGMLARPKDFKDIAGKVILLLEDEKTRKKMAQKSLKRSRAFEIKKIMKEYEKMYDRIGAGRLK
ncbi:MAG: glycosyltransferase family 4 protein [Candidatus Aenigmarchaeota archaeon]|nr:glycosyltransferase family 4 protein [Candidatus Aenigmarchaeota archaeon]